VCVFAFLPANCLLSLLLCRLPFRSSTLLHTMASADNNNQGAIRSLLLASPPGQFDIILEDLRSLLPKTTTSLEAGIIASYRLEWEAATGRSTIAAHGNDGNNNDYNEEANNNCIASISKVMDIYLASNFSSPGVRAAYTVSTSVVDDGNKSTTNKSTTLTITTYAERIELNNHQAGSWTGQYRICPTTGSLHGDISVRAHTFENGGNVQLTSNISLNTTISQTCSLTDESETHSSWGSAVTRQIKSWEEMEVVNKLDILYESMGSVYLKRLRRVMPVTRTKMEWNVLAHRVAQTLKEGHDKDKFVH